MFVIFLQVWRDQNLKWDVAEYDNISFLVVPSDEIWIPDIAVYK
jgi:hypothetical protein